MSLRAERGNLRIRFFWLAHLSLRVSVVEIRAKQSQFAEEFQV
jgi:hypothetical protein